MSTTSFTICSNQRRCNYCSEIKVFESLANDEYSFLNHPLIHEMLATDTSDWKVSHAHIHAILDQFLRRGHSKGKEMTGFLIEEHTPYVTLLNDTAAEFNAIRKISVSAHMANPDGRRTYLSLNRGTAVITEEKQLFGYLYSYGNMHYEKLLDAFEMLPKDLFFKKINLIDWGCGQAMATVTYLEYCNDRKIQQEVDKIVLIEPSEAALKRGALHVNRFLPDSNLVTINKELDELITKELELKTGINAHLFSNILDVDCYSLRRLVDLVEKAFGGKNYFVIVSPFIDDVKTEKLKNFVASFSGHKNFTSYSAICQKAHEWKEEKDWTRVSFVFSADLNFSTG